MSLHYEDRQRQAAAGIWLEAWVRHPDPVHQQGRSIQCQVKGNLPSQYWLNLLNTNRNQKQIQVTIL